MLRLPIYNAHRMGSTTSATVKSFLLCVLFVTFGWLLWSQQTQATETPIYGTLVKADAFPAVYYYGSDGKRYVFPNEKTYFSWYADFSTVKTVSEDDLGDMAIGGNVTYRPGSRMIKIQSNPKVYAVDQSGVLHGVPSEEVAEQMYGENWATHIDDISDAFWSNYEVGENLEDTDYSPGIALAETRTIGEDKGLSGPSRDVELTAIPLGDDRVSTSPERGSVMECHSSSGGPGASDDAPWITGDTWDATTKFLVDGSVWWEDAYMILTTLSGERTTESLALPTLHPTGTYPVSSSDDAYTIDRNPNSISKHEIRLSLPQHPELADEPTCVQGEVGIAVTGVPIFSATDAQGRDAVAHEVQDACGGHPQEAGEYHYHGGSACFANGDSELFGYAFDGFGIFSNLEEGVYLTNDDLDECHGHTHEITWDEETEDIYHYHVTEEFPFTVGCFMGEPAFTGRTASN